MSTPVNDQLDVLILGGGPAGSAAGRLLAGWGWNVVLVERTLASEPPDGSLAESLPPSARKALAATRLLGVVEAGGFQPNGGNTALWAGEGRSDGFARGSTGFHVLRSRFDRLLRESAAAAGAHVVGGTARVTSAPDEKRPEVEVSTHGGERVVLRPGWTLDCTGRTGIIARRYRTPEADAPTLAVVRRYHAPQGWPDINSTHALVESFPDGWAWSVPTSDRDRHVAIMVDPALQEVLEAAEDLSAAFERTLEGTTLMRSVTSAAKATGEAWACSASMYTSTRFAADATLVAGDAASFVDPLSSYGIKKALASAWLAAITVNTALSTPELTDVAVDFYSDRERRMYRAMKGSLAGHLVGPGGPDDPFWAARAGWLSDSADLLNETGEPEGAHLGRLREDPAVQKAFAELRSGSGKLELGREDTVDRPMVVGNRICLAPALVTPAFPDGIRFLRNVDLLRVIRLAPASRNPGALFEAYVTWAAENDAPPADLGDFLGTLAVLVAEGVLATDRQL